MQNYRIFANRIEGPRRVNLTVRHVGSIDAVSLYRVYLYRMADQKFIDELAALSEKMLWGSLGAVYRRCGRANCHCVTGEKHGPVFYLTRNEGGRTRNIYVPPELHDEVAARVSAYRRYRELGQQIAEANARYLGLGKKRRRRQGDRTAASAAQSIRSSHRVS